jgi:hypothetical protein
MLPPSAQLAQTMSPMASHLAVRSSAAHESSSLDRLLNELTPITLAQLDAVSLLNRVDTKFLLTVPQLAAILPRLADEYLVLEVGGRRLHQYRTLYFDTPNLDLYQLHRSSQAIRHKVRSRAYVDSDLYFFEIKAKTESHRTVKHRLATSELMTEWTPDVDAFVKSHLGPKAPALQPTLSNDFLRVTLMDKRSTERLTLDLNVQFDCDGRTAVLPGIVIAELKQGDANGRSAFAEQMRRTGVQPTSVSKYCVGVRLLVADVEHETSAAMLAAIEHLTHGTSMDRLPSLGRLAIPAGASLRA